jgi:serine/threonine-protein kinase
MSGKNREGRDPDSGDTARSDDKPPKDDKTVESKGSNKSDPELIRGKILGDKYEILSHLGSGAMGVVYKGRHQILNKDVAIKVLQSANLSDRVKKERFIREAKAQGSLNHRNIAAVHDFGLTEQDQPYFVMDFLKGETLEEYLEREKSLTCAAACRIFEQIARGLQHAHSKGIVHRDIKPSNIMLIDSEEREIHALLVDFGIAAIGEKELTKLTKADHVIGTPHYMSPEQIKGKTLDARSDIYSLGCTMFETLTGNLPFLGMNGQATMAMHLAQPPEHITSFKTKTPLPSQLAELVMRCIEKQPENRYGSAKEIAALLNDIRPIAERAEKEEPGAKELVEASIGRQINPEHAPSAMAESADDKSAVVMEKIGPKIELKEKIEDSQASSSAESRSGITNAETVSNARVMHESERLSTNTADASDSATLQNIPSSVSTSSNVSSAPPSLPPSGNSNKPSEKIFSGHDLIRLIAVAATILVCEPLNGRLAIPIESIGVERSGEFYALLRFIVDLNNYLAHNPVYQWVVPCAMAFIMYKIVNDLLDDADK